MHRPRVTTGTVSLIRLSPILSWWRVGRVFYGIAIFVLATPPIIGTYPVFSHTTDEPAHIAAAWGCLTVDHSPTNSSIHR
jgi:hypothetical protein